MGDILFSEAGMKVKRELESPSPIAAGGVYEPDSHADSSLGDTILKDRDDANDTTARCSCGGTLSRTDITRSPLSDITCEVIAGDDSPTENEMFPVADLRELVGPLECVLAGCELQTTIVQLDLDYEYFTNLSASPLFMKVGLLPADAKNPIPGIPMPRYGKMANFTESSSTCLSGMTLFKSKSPTTKIGHHGRPVWRFVFSPYAMRVPVYGKFHLSYFVEFSDRWGGFGYAQAFGRMFSACQSTEYSPNEMKELNQQQLEGNLRLRQVGDHVVINLLRY